MKAEYILTDLDSAQRCLNDLIMLIDVEDSVEKMIKAWSWQMAKADASTAVFALIVCDLGSHLVRLHNAAH